MRSQVQVLASPPPATTSGNASQCLASGRGIAQTVATFQARRRPRAQWVLAQTHHRDRTRNLPPALRNLVLRRWGRNIFHAKYQPVLELP